MVGLLVDTCVLSEIQRPLGNPQVREYIDSLDPDSLFISVITVGELTKGLELLPIGRRRQELTSWLMETEQDFDKNVLPVTSDVARRWGELSARAQTKGLAIPAPDGLIAATANWFGMHVVTRNSRHFAACGVTIIDPWLS